MTLKLCQITMKKFTSIASVRALRVMLFAGIPVLERLMLILKSVPASQNARVGVRAKSTSVLKIPTSLF